MPDLTALSDDELRATAQSLGVANTDSLDHDGLIGAIQSASAVDEASPGSDSTRRFVTPRPDQR